LADRLASMMTNSERHNGDGLSFVAANSIHASFFFSFCRSADLQIKNRTRRKKKGKGETINSSEITKAGNSYKGERVGVRDPVRMILCLFLEDLEEQSSQSDEYF
jgi:hypothetical protein